MKAIVTAEFPGRPDHEVVSRTIAVGETITGDLAKVAVENGWATEEAAPAAPTIDLDAMTVEELKAYAVDKGIDLGDATKKADIRAAIDLAGK
jgi:hypothetical protein